jgi:hypothetical protein
MKMLLSLLVPALSFLRLSVVDNVKSGALTNADAVPAVLNPAYVAGGRSRVHRGMCTTVTAAAEATSTMRFCRVRSNDMIESIRLDHGAFGTSCTVHIGAYYAPTKLSGIVIDADFFADSVDIANAGKNIDVTNESAFNTHAKMCQPLWQALGLSEDPHCDIDIVGTLAVAAQAIATACLTVKTVGGH